MAEKVIISKSKLTSLGDKIREKTGRNKLMSIDEMASAINGISTGGSGEVPKVDMLQQLVDNGYSSSLFSKYPGSDLSFISGLDTSGVTDMSYMFSNCTVLTSIPQLNTSNATDMSHMFYWCYALTSIPQLNTSNVTDMSDMFTACKVLATIPLLDTSSVTKMSNMFTSCSALTSIPQLNTSKVTNMIQMFSSCSSLKTIPQLDTSEVTTMSGMFTSCSALTSIPQLNVGKVTSMNKMFQECRALTSVAQLNTSKVTDMVQMFYNNYALVTVEGLDLISLSSCNNMFYYCYKLENLTLTNIKVSLQIGSGSTWGHLLTLDSLINTCKECINYNNSTTRKLTVGSANLTKLADVYVKFTDPTQTTIAKGEKGDVVVCESTDENAMTLTAYMTLKKWTLA
jgi:surface protein